MIKITILGGKNCRKVVRFEKRLEKVAAELNMTVTVNKKTTLPEFLEYNTYLLPTVIIGDKMIRGRFPKKRELKRILLEKSH